MSWTLGIVLYLAASMVFTAFLCLVFSINRGEGATFGEAVELFGAPEGAQRAAE